MRVAIVGFGAEGLSSYEYFSARGDEITICDANAEISLPDGAAAQLGDTYLDHLNQFDLIVRTAGLPPAKILAKNPVVAGKITSQVNEFMQVCPSHNIIGVTGTKGKGTTSTLITKTLESAGLKTHLGGNIGLPPLELLKQNITATDWIILELSSFQLIDLKTSPHIGVCLMVVSEHLDWHASADEYFNAKAQLFAHQTEQDIAIYFAENEISKRLASTGQGRLIPYFAPPGAVVADGNVQIDGQEVCKTDKLKLLGQHNWQNVCAAVTAAWQVTQNIEAIRSVLTSFSGLEHRLEFVREVSGVKYYDDSFGTTPETAIVALQAFQAPKIVILGGYDKGADYTELAETVKNVNVRKALLIGDQAERIGRALAVADAMNYEILPVKTMTDIVASAQNTAQSGDVVLLSPACASFDMFKNYKERGDQFKAAVRALP